MNITYPVTQEVESADPKIGGLIPGSLVHMLKCPLAGCNTEPQLPLMHSSECEFLKVHSKAQY